jgi:hypothetical protein
MDPQVLYLILCDSVRSAPKNLLRASVEGLQIRIRTSDPLPVKHNMVILAFLYGFQGRGVLWVQLMEEATERRIVGSLRRHVVFRSQRTSWPASVSTCSTARFHDMVAIA